MQQVKSCIDRLKSRQCAAGGSLPATLFSRAFFTDIARLMVADGVLAVNYFGCLDGNLRVVECSLRAANFTHLRVFQEARHSGMLLRAVPFEPRLETLCHPLHKTCTCTEPRQQMWGSRMITRLLMNITTFAVVSHRGPSLFSY